MTVFGKARPMQATGLAARSLDGGLVRIDANVGVSEQFTAVMSLQLGGHVQQFVAGVHPFAEDAARAFGVNTFQEEYRFQGGRLRIGTTEQYDPAIKLSALLTVAAWQGERYSVYTFAYNARSSSRLLDVLDAVRLGETEEGATALPKQPAKTPVVDLSLTTELPGLCLLDAAPAGSQLMRALPGWRGRSVAGGELFADGSDPKELQFVLVGQTAITRVIPSHDGDLDSLVPGLGGLRVDWDKG
jgi:hypothetical protein